MRVAAVVVLYNPSRRDVALVAKHARSFEHLYVWDNSPSNESYLGDLPKEGGVEYVWNRENVGMPRAINAVLDTAERQGFDYLCTLDQDSDFDSAEVLKMVEFLKRWDCGSVGIVGPFVEYDAPRIVGRRGTQGANSAGSGCGAIDVPWIIASGSFINLGETASRGLRFDERYFLDRFDVDFCREIRRRGLRVLQNPSVCLRQSLGSTNRRGWPTHAPIRHYYMFRNRLYFNFKHFGHLEALLRSVTQSAGHFWRILRHEGDRLEKFGACIRGALDFARGRM